MRSCILVAALSVGVVSAAWSRSPIAGDAGDTVPFTAAQAARGETVYRQSCAMCHGAKLEGGGGPALAGASFTKKWSAAPRSLEDLYFVTRTTMPVGVPGSLTPQQYVDLVAYMLQQNGFAAGERELPADDAALKALRFALPGAVAQAGGAAAAPAAPRDVKGGPPSGKVTGPTQATLSAAVGSTEWPYATHDYSGRRYSPLAQITPAKARSLRPVCAYQTGDPTSFQTNPIVYGGRLYLTTTHLTAAIDAATCRLRWRYQWEPKDLDSWPVNRGVAIKDGKVIRGTPDGYLVALDAGVGTLLWARQIASPAAGAMLTMPPLIYEDLVLIGPAVSELGVAGWVGAFRLANGDSVWRFNFLALADTASWRLAPGTHVAGGGVWTPMTLDASHAQLFVAAANPAPDFAGGVRLGDNLYTNSVVALDARTGALAWYKQLVPHDTHDWDLTHAGPLFRATVKGMARDLVASAGKDGLLRVIDRQTHTLVFELPVTTRANGAAPVTAAGVHACPGALGGVEWNGPAYSPITNMLYVSAVDWCATFRLADTVRFIPGQMYMGGDVTMDSVTTSKGWLTAVDASSGVVRWRYRSSTPLVAGVAASAGGVLFTGDLTGDFLALDARTGAVLYRFNTGAPIAGSVVTYAVRGKQYVAVTSGLASGLWSGFQPGAGTVFVFALP